MRARVAERRAIYTTWTFGKKWTFVDFCRLLGKVHKSPLPRALTTAVRVFKWTLGKKWTFGKSPQKSTPAGVDNDYESL
jgi:hypothetical protein